MSKYFIIYLFIIYVSHHIVIQINLIQVNKSTLESTITNWLHSFFLTWRGSMSRIVKSHDWLGGGCSTGDTWGYLRWNWILLIKSSYELFWFVSVHDIRGFFYFNNPVDNKKDNNDEDNKNTAEDDGDGGVVGQVLRSIKANTQKLWRNVWCCLIVHLRNFTGF